MRDLLFFCKKRVERFAPLLLFRLGYRGIAVPRQIGKNKRTEIEVVHKAGAPRFGTRFGKPLLPRKQIDEGALTRIGLARDRDHGLIGLYELRRRCGGSDKFCVRHLNPP